MTVNIVHSRPNNFLLPDLSTVSTIFSLHLYFRDIYTLVWHWIRQTLNFLLFQPANTVVVYNVINMSIWNGNGREWEFPHGNGMGVGISHKTGNENGGMGMDCTGMGGSGNVNSHSRSFLLGRSTWQAVTDWRVLTITPQIPNWQWFTVSPKVVVDSGATEAERFLARSWPSVFSAMSARSTAPSISCCSLRYFAMFTLASSSWTQDAEV